MNFKFVLVVVFIFSLMFSNQTVCVLSRSLHLHTQGLLGSGDDAGDAWKQDTIARRCATATSSKGLCDLFPIYFLLHKVSGSS